jgi:hypothetical protein
MITSPEPPPPVVEPPVVLWPPPAPLVVVVADPPPEPDPVAVCPPLEAPLDGWPVLELVLGSSPLPPVWGWLQPAADASKIARTVG